jgi:hypothetical protein
MVEVAVEHINLVVVYVEADTSVGSIENRLAFALCANCETVVGRGKGPLRFRLREVDYDNSIVGVDCRIPTTDRTVNGGEDEQSRSRLAVF